MKYHSSKKSIGLLLVGILLVFSTALQAQIEVEPTGPLFSPESLITNVFLGEGVEVVNINYIGSEQAVGYFTNGENDITLGRGIIMSTGSVTDAASANNMDNTTGTTTGPGTDPDLNPIAGASELNDITRYEITFIPTSDTLEFKYVFASEEYPEFACNAFNDVFGFFLTGPNPAGGMYNGENIALVPDPADPSGRTFTVNPVTINNVNDSGILPGLGCAFDYGMYYNDNTGSTTLTYDAYLDIFIAQAIVIPCEEYTIALAIADVEDDAYDTSVFLEAKSFGTGALDADFATASLDATVSEGCLPALLTFELPFVTMTDFPLEYTILGTAENGVDYQMIPDDLFVPAGDSMVVFEVLAFEDGIAEGLETIGVDIQLDPCNRDTLWVSITDNLLLPPDQLRDTTVCPGDSVLLIGLLPVALPDPPFFSNETDVPIVTISENQPPMPGAQPSISEIEVLGVVPAELQEGVIKRICVDIDHFWISDVDAFLVGPNGQFIELTTDNGVDGMDYTQTCFTPLATDPIDFGSSAPMSAAPFTGDWLPEGLWEDLWNIPDPETNGTWTLQLKDDQTGFNGTLLGWSICFNPTYGISYQWSPADGLSCTDCPNPTAAPDQTTTYTLIATDSYGCEIFDSVVVNILEPLPAPVVSCGAITENSIEFCWPPIPGSVDYTVNVEGAGWISPNAGLCHVINGLGLSDTITIEVRGMDQCSGSIDTMTCWTPSCNPPGGAIIAQTDVTCFGDTDGSVTVEGSGPQAPFEYQLLGVDTNSTGIFTNLPAGNLVVQVVDNLGCPLGVSVNIGSPEPILANELVTSNVNCNGGNDGAARLDPTGGTSPYTYQWDANAGNATTQIVNNLSAGTYFVTVTDAGSCSTTTFIEITEPTVLTLSNTTIDVTCRGENMGAIDLEVNGGTMPYMYQWTGPNGFNANVEDISNLLAGNYDVIVTDANNCTAVLMTTINQPATSITSTASIPDSICFGAANGVVSVNANGGTGALTYMWNNGSPATTLTGLSNGMYIVTITDSQSCTVLDTTFVVENPAIILNLSQTGGLCANGEDGSAVIENIFLGMVAAPFGDFNILWSNGLNTTSIDNLMAGATYTVTVTDINNCTAEASITIDNPPAIGAQVVSVVRPLCAGGMDGSASVVGEGGTAPYSYQWDANAGNQNTETASNLSAGSYEVTITDSNDCSTTTSVTVDPSTALIFDFEIISPNCFGESSGSARVNIQGGVAPYTYQWSNGNTTNAIDSVIGGTYQLTVTDNSGCSTIEDVIIPQPSELSAQITTTDISCSGGQDGSILLEPQGGTPSYSYSLDGVNYNGSSLQIALSAGSYPVYLQDLRGCEIYLGDYLIEEPDPLFVEFDEPVFIEFGESTTLAPIITGGVGSLTFAYDQSDSLTLSCLFCENPETSPENTTSYQVVVTDDNGCTAVGNVLVQVKKNRTVYVPTGFAPGGDGDERNNVLRIHGKQIAKVLAFQVYDRWGSLIYEALDYEYDQSDINQGWDGTFRGEPMNTGVFVWFVQVEYVDGNIEDFKGNTTLIRD